MIAIVVVALLIALVIGGLLGIGGTGFYVLFGLCIVGVIAWGYFGSKAEDNKIRSRVEAQKQREADQAELKQLRAEVTKLRDTPAAAPTAQTSPAPACSKYRKRGDGHCADCGVHFYEHPK